MPDYLGIRNKNLTFTVERLELITGNVQNKYTVQYISVSVTKTCVWFKILAQSR
jgi:hypothetical protein